jgi:hypothetical protein
VPCLLLLLPVVGVVYAVVVVMVGGCGVPSHALYNACISLFMWFLLQRRSSLHVMTAGCSNEEERVENKVSCSICHLYPATADRILCSILLPRHAFLHLQNGEMKEQKEQNELGGGVRALVERLSGQEQ